MNYLDLFHGIGGFALGAYWAGMKFENHYCSDIEPWCQELYAKRFPESIQLGDITKINAQDLPTGDWILTGGFPCQDISIAGKGAGIHGERSGLWFEYWRLIRDLRPRFAIMENVGMLVHRGLREVLGSLAEIGYDAEWQDIRASDVGAPHRRERIWIVAYPGLRDTWKCGNSDEMFDEWLSEKKSTDKTCGSDSQIPNPSLQLPHGSGEARRRRGEFTDGSDVDDATVPGLQGEKPARGGSGEPGLSTECGDELSIPSYAGTMRRERTQTNAHGQVRRGGRPGNFQWWSTEPDVGMLVDGLPAGMDRFEGRLSNNAYKRVDQLKGLGNAIVPQIAEILFRQIKRFL